VKDDRFYLLHVRDSIDRILSYTQDGPECFLADTKTQDAVIRNLEVIGEAVKSLSENRKSAHPDIPWKQIAGMRDTLIHRYFGVDLTLVWDVVEKEIPTFRARIDSMLSPHEGTAGDGGLPGP
jgi:uncharacterized protein with HEPN domain